MNVIHPRFLPVRMPLWPSLVLWLVADRQEYTFWSTLLCVIVGSLLWASWLVLVGVEVRLPPAKIVSSD